MKIQFKSAQAIEINLYKYKVQDLKTNANKENSFKINYKPLYLGKGNNHFVVEYNLVLDHPKEFIFSVRYLAVFIAPDGVPSKGIFENSFFININAPAIAYPYLRSFVSTILLNSGYKPIALPTVNFLETTRGKRILALQEKK